MALQVPSHVVEALSVVRQGRLAEVRREADRCSSASRGCSRLRGPQNSPKSCRARERRFGAAVASVDCSDDFAARLTLALQVCNLSRAQLSSQLGVHKSMVSRWLSGEMKPTGYNLARISAAIAGLKPSFNMSLWTAPRSDFEAALGVSAAPAAQLARGAEPSNIVIGTDPPATAVPPVLPRRGRRLGYAAIGTAAVLVVALTAALLWRAISPAQHAGPRPPDFDSPSVAVMPFVNMSGDPAKEYLGDGISEEILNDLANMSDLRVAARTSSFAFKGRHADIREIAKKLDVRTILEGSVREEGDRVRIVAQLINAETGFHIWSARYDRKLDDILAVQDKIAGAIVRALSQKLVRRHQAPSIAPEAYRNYLQAQYFFRQRSVTGSHRANELLTKVLKQQPDFAAAYAMRGHLLMLTAGDDRALLAEAQRMIAKALQLEPDNQDALDTEVELSIGTWNWPAVNRAGRQLLAQPKRSANFYNGIGFFYQYMGFPKLALEARRQAAELDPLAFSYRNNLAMAKWHVGRLNEAIATALVALDLQPNHLGELYNLCQMTAAVGKISEAGHYAKLIAALPSPQFPWVPSACDIEIALGKHQNVHARALLDRMSSKGFGKARFGLLYARAGDLSKAMKSFSEAYDHRDQSLVWVLYDAGTPKSLLDDPRWQALWRRPLLAEWQSYHNRIAADLGAKRLRSGA